MQMPAPDQAVIARRDLIVARLIVALSAAGDVAARVIADPAETRAYECDALSAYHCRRWPSCCPRPPWASRRCCGSATKSACRWCRAGRDQPGRRLNAHSRRGGDQPGAHERGAGNRPRRSLHPRAGRPHHAVGFGRGRGGGLLLCARSVQPTRLRHRWPARCATNSRSSRISNRRSTRPSLPRSAPSRTAAAGACASPARCGTAIRSARLPRCCWRRSDSTSWNQKIRISARPGPIICCNRNCPGNCGAGNIGCMMQIGTGTALPLVHIVELLIGPAAARVRAS